VFQGRESIASTSALLCPAEVLGQVAQARDRRHVGGGDGEREKRLHALLYTRIIGRLQSINRGTG
jgi:hypothetical protein